MRLTPIQMRRAFDKSREDVAELLGIHPNTLDRLEKEPSRFSIEQADKLCKFYGVTMDDFSFLP